MFDPTSRYASLPVKDHPGQDAKGEPRTIRYVVRRFIPPVESAVPLVEHRVTEGERLDHLAAKYLGDPTQFWRIADANAALRPEELTADPGRTVILALPQT